MASAQCQAGLWTKAADTLVEAISKWPEGVQDILDTALDQVRVRRAGDSHTGLKPGSIAYALNTNYRTWREGAWVPHDESPSIPSASRLIAAVATQVYMLHSRNRYPCSCGKSPRVRSSSLPGNTYSIWNPWISSARLR